jgi:hypothetical protein
VPIAGAELSNSRCRFRCPAATVILSQPDAAYRSTQPEYWWGAVFSRSSGCPRSVRQRKRGPWSPWMNHHANELLTSSRSWEVGFSSGDILCQTPA